MSENKGFDKLSLLYQENAKIAAIFWEWRNKIITYFFTAIGALLTLVGWLFQQQFTDFIPPVLLFGALVSFISLLLDYRNESILKECYQVGKDIELELREEKGAIFAFIKEAHDKGNKVTYTETLRVIYLIVGSLLLILSIVGFFSQLQK